MHMTNESGLSFQYNSQGQVTSQSCRDIQIHLLDTDSPQQSTFSTLLHVGGETIDMVGAGASSFGRNDRQLSWTGQKNGISWTVDLVVAEKEPVWEVVVTLNNDDLKPMKYDINHIQSLGLAPRAAVRSNESYIGHYLDHQEFDTALNGKTIITRQNLSQGGMHPWLMSTCMQGADEVVSDGLDVYGPRYNLDRKYAWTQGVTDGLRHREHSLHGLILRDRTLAQGEKVTFRMVHVYMNDHLEPSAENDLKLLEKLPCQKPIPVSLQVLERIDHKFFNGIIPTTQKIKESIPGTWRHMEEQDGKLYSFFSEEGRVHVVTQFKESLSARAHAHILRTGESLSPEKYHLALTCHMNGGFGSQLCMGNTSFHQFIPVLRGQQLPSPHQGTRIYIKRSDVWEQLGIPSFWECRDNSCRWTYLTETGRVIVSVFASGQNNSIYIQVDHDDEFIAELRLEAQTIAGSDIKDLPVVKKSEKNLVIQSNKKLDLKLHMECGEDSNIEVDVKGVLRCRAVSELKMAFSAQALDTKAWSNFNNRNETSPVDFATQKSLLSHTSLEVKRLESATPWMHHNAMIHFSSPHGIEQFGGAAWGVRDVCQGPIEWLLSLDDKREARETMLKVYANQYVQGHWPQWFMFDEYKDIRQEHHHGDVIVWPLKALLEYIQYSGDDSIMDEILPYHDGHPSPLREHVRVQLDQIKAMSIEGTALISYGDGDWNDSLQPANPAMKANMASTWTVQLLYQTLKMWRNYCAQTRSEDLERVREWLIRIKIDFYRYHIKDGVMAGFVHFGEGGEVTHLLHPSDRETGISYRLLPINRGIISEILEPEDAHSHVDLLKEHLLGPDGARLMDRPPVYRYGQMEHFQRAETASNFGREIGMMYMHAHIRYAEAMAKMGDADALLKALLQVISVEYNSSVSRGGLRQANAYFSSSDGNFKNRAEAARDYSKLMKGEIQVDGGWRIYSSGPGIFMGVLKSKFLGLDLCYDQWVIDPVLPVLLNGLQYRTVMAGKDLNVTYEVQGEGATACMVQLNGRILDVVPGRNPYRKGGVVVPKALLEQLAEGQVHDLLIRLE